MDSKVIILVMRITIPCTQLFGFYIIANGHLSPGGAFAGGTIVAAAYILKLLVATEPTTKAEIDLSALIESSSLSLYLFLGAIGLLTHNAFLANRGVFPLGVAGTQFSSIFMVMIAVAVGAKVASTMRSLFRELVAEAPKEG